MKLLPLKPLLLILVGILILEGCGMQNKFASSFGKRRYTKGFYWDTPKNIARITTISKRGEELPPIHGLNAKLSVIKPERDVNRDLFGSVIGKSKVAKRDIAGIISSGIQIHLKPVASAITIAISSQDGVNKNEDKQGSGVFSVIGLILVLLSIPLLLYGALLLVLDSIAFFFIAGFLFLLAGTICCIYALASDDKLWGLAMAGFLIGGLLIIIIGFVFLQFLK